MPKNNKLSTGVADLDIILEGGYFNPGNIILIGPSGIEKTALGYHFVSTGENAYIICGNTSPADIINKASTFGINLTNSKFIDCYTATLGGAEPPSTDKIKIVPGPSALNDISLAINEAIRESNGKKMRVVFDTLSTFVLYNSQDSMRKFLSVIEGRLKTAGATTLYLVDEGVHDRQLVSVLQQGMDEVFTIADKTGKLALVVPGVDMPLPIKVGPAGIIIV